MTLSAGDERLQLIPVLCTMLKFSPQEKDQLAKIATGEVSLSCVTSAVIMGAGNILDLAYTVWLNHTTCRIGVECFEILEWNLILLVSLTNARYCL